MTFKEFKSYLLDFFEVVFIGSLVFCIVYFFVGQLMEVSGTSMYPTLKDKEQLVAEKLSIKYKDLYRGEIVIFKSPVENKLLIKRVIGLPGESIMVSNDRVFVNGVELQEAYLASETTTKPDKFLTQDEEKQIPDNFYVVMGDNRQDSFDSRHWGFLPKENVIGRAVLVYYPLRDLRKIN